VHQGEYIVCAPGVPRAPFPHAEDANKPMFRSAMVLLGVILQRCHCVYVVLPMYIYIYMYNLDLA
jgi:hypothetical protein